MIAALVVGLVLALFILADERRRVDALVSYDAFRAQLPPPPRGEPSRGGMSVCDLYYHLESQLSESELREWLTIRAIAPRPPLPGRTSARKIL